MFWTIHSSDFWISPVIIMILERIFFPKILNQHPAVFVASRIPDRSDPNWWNCLVNQFTRINPSGYLNSR